MNWVLKENYFDSYNVLPVRNLFFKQEYSNSSTVNTNKIGNKLTKLLHEITPKKPSSSKHCSNNATAKHQKTPNCINTVMQIPHCISNVLTKLDKSIKIARGISPSALLNESQDILKIQNQSYQIACIPLFLCTS